MTHVSLFLLEGCIVYDIIKKKKEGKSYMEMKKEYQESDWKLFRKKIIGWQENYMDRLNHEYMELLSQNKKPSEKFWELEKRIYKDKHKTGVIVDMRRSRLILNILNLLDEEAIEMDDLHEFSDVLKETIQEYMSARR